MNNPTSKTVKGTVEVSGTAKTELEIFDEENHPVVNTAAKNIYFLLKDLIEKVNRKATMVKLGPVKEKGEL